MSTLDDLNAGPGGIAGFVATLSRRFRPVSRRDVLVGATVAAAALATKPKEYALTPVAAYATICGPGNTASSGWTVFCCTVNNGVNACPPGSFAAGWWKAADSSWCGGGYRYIVDCNASCSKCTTGCSDNLCDTRCWSCSCGSGSTATCDQRRVCCNAFRYGQCNTQVKCSGGVHCRVVSCLPPYQWANCTTTSLVDNRTSEHSAPCLPAWGAIEYKYRTLGEQKSYLKASIGPERAVGDNRGRYVAYQGGIIYWSGLTGAWGMSSFVKGQHDLNGGISGRLGYPVSDQYSTTVPGGWIQRFETGAICDSPSTTTHAVAGEQWTLWQKYNREWGVLGFPTGPYTATRDGWIQTFQKGALTSSAHTTPQIVTGWQWTSWQRYGRENGVLGFPTGPYTVSGDGWLQPFDGGALVDSASTSTSVVLGAIFVRWTAAGREKGLLRYPLVDATTTDRGVTQSFQGGGLWALNGDPARLVYGAVLSTWQAQGGADGRYGWPVTDTTSTPDGRLTCTFEGGTITA